MNLLNFVLVQFAEFALVVGVIVDRGWRTAFGLVVIYTGSCSVRATLVERGL